MMKRIYTLCLLSGLTLAGMAQGWPENYGGVMLQGFYWDGYADAQWTRLEKQADDLSKVFDLVWLPQSGDCGGQSMGYDDLYWFPGHYNSSFGTEEDLRSLISTLKEKGVGTIADVVINHRKNLSSWIDFPKEEYNGETYELVSTDIVYDDYWYDDKKVKHWTRDQGFQLSSNNDTGEGWSGLRDLDHKSENVQKNVKAYLNMLLQDLGYAGFRYDMVKGYSADFTKLYNEDAKPQFSVGEYWDSTSKIRNWIDKSGKTSAAFDFQFRYTVRNAINKGDWRYLAQQNDGNWPLVSNDYENGGYRQWAVTFVENHDMQDRGTTQDYTPDPIKKDTLAANAYLLAMPGTPCVFKTHWNAYKQEIANMVTVRKAVGIENTSATEQMASTKGYYAVKTTGTKGTLLAVVGSQAGNYPPSAEWKEAISGYHYIYYVNGIEPESIGYPEMSADEPEPDGQYAGVPSFCTMEEGEQCAFFEAPVSWGGQIFVWAWMNNSDGEVYLGTSWPGVNAMKIGTADNGNSVWKWDVTGDTMPDNIIFSGGGQQTPDMKFTNGGYYFGKEGLKATVAPTAIRSIGTECTDGQQKVYTLDGRFIGTADSQTVRQLPKGIYIVNNKKIIVR